MILHKKLLLFGSFNPVHLGHIQIAQHAMKELYITEACFVLSPQSPFKNKEDLLPFDIRFELLKEAKKDYPFITPCNIEQNMPLPNYTYKTIETLKKQYTNTHFFLLMGSDNWLSFDKWKNYEYVLKNTTLVIYPRTMDFQNTVKTNIENEKIVFLKNFSYIDISSSFIRNKIKKREDTINFLSQHVYQKIKTQNLYK